MAPRLAAFVQTLKQRAPLLAPLLALALARLVYQRRRRLQDQLQLLRALSEQAAAEHAPETPALEWDVVAADGTQAMSLVLPAEPSADAPHKLLLLVLPGNPGVPFFYLPLVRQLARRHGRRHEVRCLSHAGHCAPWQNGGRAFSLQQQLEHKAYYVRQRLRQDPTLRLVLVGHSIGSHFVLDIARRFPQHIAKLVLMQPTVMHMARTPKGKQMMPLFNHYERGVSLVAAVEYFVPLSLRRWIVRRVIGTETSATLQLASMSLVDASVMRNVLGMAADEMKEVTELDDELVAKFEDRLLFVYSAVDEWVPPEFMQEYQVRFPNAQHRVVPQAHAFMMEPNGTRDMAAHISQWVGDVLDNKQVRVDDAMVA